MIYSDKQKFSPETQQEIVRLYLGGKKTLELKQIYSCSRTAISDVLIRHGIKRRSGPTETRKWHFDTRFFETIDSQEKAYFLGILYADGFITKTGLQVNLSLVESDKKILLDLNRVIGNKAPLMFIRRKLPRQNMYRIVLGSKKIVEDLARVGCHYRKSLTLKFPSETQVPTEFLSHFIRGYMDGDGCVCIHKKTILLTFISSSSFCESLKHTFSKVLGRDAGTITPIKTSPGISRLFYGGNKQVITLLDFIYKDSKIHLDRKRDKYLSFKERKATKTI